MNLSTQFWSWFDERPAGGVAENIWTSNADVNPATGLPMNGAVDFLGNPMGTNLHSTDHWHHHHDPHLTSSCIDDHSLHSAPAYDPDRGW